MFKIGEFSKLAHTTIRTLHYYEQKGLLLPEKIDQRTNYRYYTAQQLTKMNTIKSLQQIGFSLEMIKDILNHDTLDSLDDYYELRQDELREEIKKMKQKQQLVKGLQHKAQEGYYLEKYPVTLTEIPERQVISLRKKIKSYDEETLLWNELYDYGAQQKVIYTQPPFGMTLFHDTEFKNNDIDVEVQTNVSGDYKNLGNLTFYTAPAFKMASVTFSGSYEQMPQVTEAIALWIEMNNYQTNGLMINIPIVSPAQENNPDHWVTQAGFCLID